MLCPSDSWSWAVRYGRLSIVVPSSRLCYKSDISPFYLYNASRDGQWRLIIIIIIIIIIIPLGQGIPKYVKLWSNHKALTLMFSDDTSGNHILTQAIGS